ncbi:MAG: GNAT family N-acetyltransferase [Firmicutes bacterium]|nr:GNAT family N-acetyltransferase [Bacillota bacterium]
MKDKDLYVRPLEEQDVPKVMDLLEQVNLVHFNGRPDIFKHDTKFTEEDVKRSFIGNEMAPVFVCVEVNSEGNEAVLGHAFCEIQESLGNSVVQAKRSLYIDDICVDEKARGKGIGRRLYNYVLEFAKKDGDFDNITLNVWNFNEPAYNFYIEMGMTPQRTIMEKPLK